MIPVRQTPILNLVLLDTPTPIVQPDSEVISIGQWEDAQTQFRAVLASTGLPAPCTGGTFIFTARRPGYGVELPIISRQGTEIDYSAGVGYFPFGSVDTGIPVRGYRIDVDFIDSAGKRWQCLLASDFFILEAEGVPNTPVTPAESQNPLAQGLPGTILFRQIFGGTGLSGDTVVLDSTLSPPPMGQLALRMLKNAPFDPNTMVIFGWLLEDLVLNGFALLMTQGQLPIEILPVLSAGQLTVDFTSGLIRNILTGEFPRGLADTNGNAVMFPTGAL